MAVQARFLEAPGTDKFTAAAALLSGEVLQMADGRAGVVTGAGAGFASGDSAGAITEGKVRCTKTASIAILKGGKVYWDRSANAAHFRPQSGDFYLGVCAADAAAADTTVDVLLNEEPVYAIELGKGSWTQEATLGLGVDKVSVAGEITRLSFDAVIEAAQAALLSDESVPVADGAILEARMAIFDIGDNAALDINVGLANASHATDADAITESVFVHLDGASLNILAESDDGTVEVAATDTTVDAVDNTFFEVWIDARDPADIQIYIDGVLVLGATVFRLDAATGPMKALAHIEKTSDDTLADVRLEFLRVRSGD